MRDEQHLSEHNAIWNLSGEDGSERSGINVIPFSDNGRFSVFLTLTRSLLQGNVFWTKLLK